jgi:hypothetical protein
MKDMLAWGLSHLYSLTAKHTDIDVLVGLPDSPKFPIKATFTGHRPVYDAGRVKMIGQRFHLMVDQAAFLETGLPIVRGLEFELASDPTVKYELVIDTKGTFYYNDYLRLKLVFIVTESHAC